LTNAKTTKSLDLQPWQEAGSGDSSRIGGTLAELYSDPARFHDFWVPPCCAACRLTPIFLAVALKDDETRRQIQIDIERSKGLHKTKP
jgi:hypothetical protein